MSGLNRWQGVGNLGANPELRTTKSGTSVLNLRLACTTKRLDQDKKEIETVLWISAVVWGRRGEGLANILSKGSRVYVEGELRISSYEDKEGTKRERTEVFVEELVLCGDPPRREDRDDRDRRGDDSDRRPAERDRDRGRDRDRDDDRRPRVVDSNRAPWERQ